MAVFDHLGASLRQIYAADGRRLLRAYALDGSLLWRGTADFTFSGAQNPFGAWKFYKISDTANVNYNSTAEAAAAYDDSTWETVQIPHDWSIYNDFHADSAATYEGGYLDGGDSWYRCTVTATGDMLSDHTLLYFGGVYMESTVYLNGKKLGENHHGYSPFWFDVTKNLQMGTNVLAVFVRNRQPSSRWYSGSGIYRPVYLLSMEGAGKWVDGVQVTTPNLETQKDGNVDTAVSFTLHNTDAEQAASVKIEILKDGAAVGTQTTSVTAAHGETPVTVTVPVGKPDLWGVGTPNLYNVKITLTGDFGSYAAPEIVFGYRWTKWEVDTGFWLNGENIKLKGVCMHHDLGCIGAEVNRSAMERQIDLLIDMGCNAIRLTHNPGSTEFLDLCMRKGVLVVEELFDMWTVGKNRYDFARFFHEDYQTVVKNTLLRDRNNPAIIMWSLGNEINRTANYTAEQVQPIVTKLITAVKTYDTTRPVTMGEDSPSMEAAQTCMQLLDVCGINYSRNDLSVPHGLDKPCYGSETTSALSSRGIYARDDEGLQCSSLDDDKVNWGSYAADALKAHMESAYSGGMFVWTGFDYIGEPTPFNKYPAKSSYFGIIDLAGFPKDIYYMYQSRWATEPMVHIFPRNLDSFEDSSSPAIFAYSNCTSVELFVNGMSCGKKTQAEIGAKYQFNWSGAVNFTAGVTISAKGYDAAGAVVATDEVKTSTGTAAKLALTAYKSSVNIATDDLAFITCEVQDANGVMIPTANNSVTFAVTGGTVLGTDNGNAACVEPMRTPTKSAFSGKVLCVCRHDGVAGTMTVSASAEGLTGADVEIDKKIRTNMEIDVENIILKKSALTLPEGDSETLVATVLPDNATNKTVTWSVSPAGCATVSGGVVTAVKAGSCTVTATCGGKSASCDITVLGGNFLHFPENVSASSVGLTWQVDGGLLTITGTVPENRPSPLVMLSRLNMSVMIKAGKYKVVVIGNLNNPLCQPRISGRYVVDGNSDVYITNETTTIDRDFTLTSLVLTGPLSGATVNESFRIMLVEDSENSTVLNN